MRTALLFQHSNYVGREYYARLAASMRAPDLLIAAGSMGAESRALEIERTAGRWMPPKIPATATVHRFDRLDDPAILTLMRDADIDVAIQGGIGILREPFISAPRFGFVNVHPGRLPAYRGSSCPEWAILDGAPVVATAHVIDEGIDTGPVLLARPMGVDAGWDYCDFRANLYAHCAAVLIETLDVLAKADAEARPRLAVPQSAEGARVLPRMPMETLTEVKRRFPAWARQFGRKPIVAA